MEVFIMNTKNLFKEIAMSASATPREISLLSHEEEIFVDHLVDQAAGTLLDAAMSNPKLNRKYFTFSRVDKSGLFKEVNEAIEQKFSDDLGKEILAKKRVGERKSTLQKAFQYSDRVKELLSAAEAFVKSTLEK